MKQWRKLLKDHDKTDDKAENVRKKLFALALKQRIILVKAKEKLPHSN